MFWKNVYETALAVRTLQHSPCLPQIRYQSGKSSNKPYSKADKMKNLKKEENLFFGKLIETSKQRQKRIKLEGKGRIPKSRVVTVDSELEWVKNSGVQLKVIRFSKHLDIPQETEAHRILYRKEFISQPHQSKAVKLRVNPNFKAQNVVPHEVEIQNNIFKSSDVSGDGIKEEVSEFKIIKSNDSQAEDPSNDQCNEGDTANVSSSPNVKQDAPKEEIPELRLILDKKLEPATAQKALQQMLSYPLFDDSKIIKGGSYDERNVYRISPMENPQSLKLPSVTKILTASMSDESKATLEKWKARMTEQLGVRGFTLYQQELFNEGKLLHSTIFSHLKNDAFEVDKKIAKPYSSLKAVFNDVKGIKALESHVVHPKLSYRGILDCVALYRGELCVIDWKKSDKLKNTISLTYDAPLQVASYVGALNSDANYPFQITKGLIVIAYTDGTPAQVHELNRTSLQLYWQYWLQRLQKYYQDLNSPGPAEEEKKKETS